MAMGSDLTRANGQPLTAPARAVARGAGARLSQWRLVGAVALALGLASCGDDSSGGAPLPDVEAGVTDSTASESNGSESHATTTPPATNPTHPGGHQTDDETSGSPSPVTDTDPASSHSSSQPTAPQPASIETRLQTPGATNPLFQAFRKGSASAAGLSSLKYHISAISVCESLEAQGSGFNNPAGCLELYRGDESSLMADLAGDWTHLADAARASDDGFVDLVSPSSRNALTRTTTLDASHVRSYNYGIITWALPVKLTATIDLGDGDFLYTHDGVTTSELIGVDNFKNYFTRSATSLLEGPAEEAVVLLGNGGNWFKFQQPFSITEQDIAEGRGWVLDLVFNPDGIVKGYEEPPSNANLRDEDDNGMPLRAITVPMIDLVPVPHRAADPIVRESYLAHVSLESNAFDVRVELYTLENDPNQAVLGVDVKTLVTDLTTQPPPDASKVSYVDAGDAGTLRFGSYNDSTLLDNFARLAVVGETHTARIACATHDDREAAEGGAFIMLSACPAPLVDIEFTLQSRTRLDGSLTIGGELPDGGAPESLEPVETDAGLVNTAATAASESALDAGASMEPNSTLAPNDTITFDSSAENPNTSATSEGPATSNGPSATDASAADHTSAVADAAL